MSRRLRVEHELFRNTLEGILSECVGDKLLDDLLSDPGGEIWTDSSTGIELSLKRKLQNSYGVFFETVVSMRDALQEFCDRLRLDPDGKVNSVFGPSIRDFS